jgi:hypothetical protein
VQSKASVESKDKNHDTGALTAQNVNENAVHLERTQMCLYNEWRGLFGWSYEWRAILGWGSCKEQVTVLQHKVLSHFASHPLFVLSDPIGNHNLTDFSILLASSTLPFDLCLPLHQNGQKPKRWRNH